MYELGIVAIQPGETKEKLEELAHKIKNEVLNENTNIINEYKASLGTDNMPKNVRIQREFMNQYLFFAGWISVHIFSRSITRK